MAAQTDKAAGELKSFDTGMFGCLGDIGTCLIGYLAPCVLYGQNVEKLNGGEGFMGACLLYACCPLFTCIFAASTRKQLRDKYGLKEEPCGDCMVHCCCTCLAICQEARELKHHGL